ncbi:cytochrome c peroxidase/methylamine utilization protein MauG [Acidomonas methanolica NBRC 104435]|uniref:Cytochrome c peroxidase/methylamine utilization protein MauG n=1 Tax=Acidomonas methanolica NBRC 104435 TaxID=1231351 RepID=A0A023D3H4_ACIMT|nr:cytochrome c peroxidase/methylamine utilization protein MauG [Acidomonas methanolica NBRC 104435]GEK99537.1 cytochrome-c peroxidase [Acidomonas methanolica NBRC 104435]
MALTGVVLVFEGMPALARPMLAQPRTDVASVAACDPREDGSNPCPRQLRRPPRRPLSAMAQIGKALFYDRELSGSGKISCASCHDPAAHYGPARADSVFTGGVGLDRQGHRAILSLTYLERQPNFSIGPDDAVADDTVAPIQAPHDVVRGSAKSASNTAASAVQLVPQGGLFWDGRADTLQQQATGPLYDPAEMAATRDRVLHRLRTAPYAGALMDFAGYQGRRYPDYLVAEALFALARYQIEETDFHSYSSKFDDWLEGKARFTPEERRGYLLFNDPKKGNCAACHVDQMKPDHLPPLFTDHQYESLGVPRNMDLVQNRNPAYFDLGVCDRQPDGKKLLAPYCGMFATPTLRNVAARKVFFHNGVFHSLDDVMDFYVLRDIDPARFYGKDAHGRVHAYDDLPAPYRDNLDTTDAPFDRKPGDKPALDENERQAVIAFLKTLTDRKTTQP